MAANSIAHEAFCAGQAWQQAAAAQERPCVLWKPRLFRDGNQWCALLGENVQEGVVGFGDSPDAAMWAFDKAWLEKLPPAPCAQPAPSIPEGWKLVPIEVIDLYSFMCAAFVPMTPQQGQIALQLDLAKRAMLAVAPEFKP